MLHRIRAAANAVVAKLERRVLDWLLPHIVAAVDQEVLKAIEGLRDELEEHIEHVVQEKVESTKRARIQEWVDERFDEYDFVTLVKDLLEDDSTISKTLTDEIRDNLEGENLVEALNEYLENNEEATDRIAAAVVKSLTNRKHKV